MLPVLVRWVQTYLYCVAPPALRLGSVLLIFGPFYCRSCGRYPYTLRLDWARLLCCGFGGWYPSYRCPPFIRLVGVAVIITDAGRSRGPNLAVCWHTDITATCSRDTTTIYLPPKLLYASFPSRHLPPHPLLPLPSLQTASNNISTSEEAGYSGQAEVFHAPQPACPRDRESSLEIPRLETGGTTGGWFR